LKQGSREQQIKNFCAQLRATSKAMLHGAEKKEGSFAKEIGDVRGAAALRGCDCFHLFFAASSGASNCDLRIGAAATEMYPTWISDFESELFLQGSRGR
jgi:hypothetical protein